MLRFDIYLARGHANNFLVQNVSPALVRKLVVKFEGTILEETVDYDMYKTFGDLFLSEEKRDNMVPEGIQNKEYARSAQTRGTRKPLGRR